MRAPRSRAFTLLELLVAIAVTAVVVTLLLQIISTSSTAWRNVSGKSQAYAGARAAFDALAKSLAQATLNTEYDYYNSSRQSRLILAANNNLSGLTNFVPDTYGRASSLHFVSGKNLVPGQHNHAVFFQAPLDFDTSRPPIPTTGQLNAVGYFIHYGDDTADRPSNVSPTNPAPRKRFRLMQFLQPTTRLDTYRDATGDAWFKTEVGQDPPGSSHLLAENIVVLAILPKRAEGATGAPLAPNYEYDSRITWGTGTQPPQMHQLPPVVRVLMVAIDETSADRNPDLGREFDALFQDPDNFDADLQAVEAALRTARANYQVFQTDVPVRAAKWSE